VTVLSVPTKLAHRDQSVQVAGVTDVPQKFTQNICQHICLPEIKIFAYRKSKYFSKYLLTGNQNICQNICLTEIKIFVKIFAYRKSKYLSKYLLNGNQNICQNICLPEIRADPLLNPISSHLVAVICFRTHRHPFAVYKLFMLRLVMLQGFLSCFI
jgi:hypothetical protein